MKNSLRLSLLIILSFFIISCTYNPFLTSNKTTGSLASTAIGAGAAGGSVALLGGSKPFIALAAVGGGAFGYYISTLRHDGGGIINAGGQVYQVGSFIGIYIPSDLLFEPNTANLLPQSKPILESAVKVLNRNPNNNVIISGNTSGFYCSKWEQRLSERRAKVISAYLWSEGINNFKEFSTNMRKLTYVGYGDYFPIANHYRNDGIRANSRIQIVSYPSDCDLKLDPQHQAMRNIAAPDYAEPQSCQDCLSEQEIVENYQNEFK